MRFILASSSPARLATLRHAGIEPEVCSPDVAEEAVSASSPAALTAELARAKATAVLGRVDASSPFVLVACDSLLELDGHAWGKPHTTDAVMERWRHMRGRQALFHTGHHVVVRDARGERSVNRVASTAVTFADLADDEIAAYAATGEPQRVAGGFTIDSLGGPFVTGVAGDPHNVVGISLPLVRQMLLDLGIDWPSLWARRG